MFLVVYLSMTAVILVLDHICPGADGVAAFKYAVMVSLFLSVLFTKKRFPEQRLMTLALFFAVVADFFLVFSTTLHLQRDLTPLGIAGFFAAYLCLIAAYQKNFKVGRGEILSAVPIAAVFLYAFFSLQAYVKGPVLIGLAVFGMVLCYMAWTSVCTVFRNYFHPKSARLIALSGILMFICDLGVAYSLFHPAFAGGFDPWLKNIIWGAYIPGWTLLRVLIAEEKLLRG